MIAIVFGGAFVYNHPHLPITLDDATSCQVYRAKSLRTLTGQWINEGTHPAGSRPVLNSQSLHGQLDQYLWIDKGPIPCNAAVTETIKQVLHDLRIYQRPDNRKSIFDPNYAYKLSSPSGSLLIFIDDTQNWFEIKKYGGNGKLVTESGVIQGEFSSKFGDGWRKIINQNIPIESMISTF